MGSAIAGRIFFNKYGGYPSGPCESLGLPANYQQIVINLKFKNIKSDTVLITGIYRIFLSLAGNF